MLFELDGKIIFDVFLYALLISLVLYEIVRTEKIDAENFFSRLLFS